MAQNSTFTVASESALVHVNLGPSMSHQTEIADLAIESHSDLIRIFILVSNDEGLPTVKLKGVIDRK